MTGPPRYFSRRSEGEKSLFASGPKTALGVGSNNTAGTTDLQNISKHKGFCFFFLFSPPFYLLSLSFFTFYFLPFFFLSSFSFSLSFLLSLSFSRFLFLFLSHSFSFSLFLCFSLTLSLAQKTTSLLQRTPL